MRTIASPTNCPNEMEIVRVPIGTSVDQELAWFVRPSERHVECALVIPFSEDRIRSFRWEDIEREETAR